MRGGKTWRGLREVGTEGEGGSEGGSVGDQ